MKMKIHEVKCPNCNAVLEAEDDLGTFYCKYCGTKIIMEEQLDAVVRFREFEHEERMQTAKLSHEQYKIGVKERRKKENRKGCLLVFIIVFIGILIISVIIPNAKNIIMLEKEKSIIAQHDKETIRLNQIETEVLQAVENKQYELALVKANTLHYNVVEEFSVNYGVANKWEKRRKELIQLIQTAGNMLTPVPTIVYPAATPETPNWPRSTIAQLLPDPKGTNCVVNWDAEYGFVVDVKGITKEKYDEYVNQCWERGFSKDYSKGDKHFYADNEGGYHLSLKFEGNETMWVRLDKPDER